MVYTFLKVAHVVKDTTSKTTRKPFSEPLICGPRGQKT